MSSADAVSREAAWLSAYNPADSLPALLASLGGPFDIVQPYLRRTPPGRKRQLYVVRTNLQVERFGFNRKINHHTFDLRITWPQSSTPGDAEEVQQALDNAVELVVQRVSGLFLDKTHGARFMAVAEDPAQIDVRFDDPSASLQGPGAELTCAITYRADDVDYTS
jgi:hypothetical protein